ncbi:helix-turn-helix domain-containing protein [Planctomycetales bacterium ZRK34]|nr:helix-turn-helix domain-containing protein [Planctomycetales bacterium ZRK34]
MIRFRRGYVLTDMSTERLLRVIRLLRLIEADNDYTSDGLADKLGISRRTLYRDLKVLRQAGVRYGHVQGKGLVASSQDHSKSEAVKKSLEGRKYGHR